MVLGARSAGTIREVADEITDAGGTALAVPTNIVEPAQCARLVAAALGELGRVDCLVNNAFRMDTMQPFEEVDLETWRKIVDVNLFGSLQLTREVVDADEGAGRRIRGLRQLDDRAQGAAEPGRLHDLQGGAAERRPGAGRGARPHQDPGQLHPARGHVGAQRRGCGSRCGPRSTGPRSRRSTSPWPSEMPLGIIPPDDDVANAAVFFASDLSRVITGQALNVNGGEVFS